MCRTDGCGKYALFGVAGTKTAEFCSQHAPDGMEMQKEEMITEGCDKQPSFGEAGTKTPKYCTQHAPDGMVNVTNRKCISK
ncbi:unnamed protein product, partial [Ascophyllum nodosum]